MIRTYTELIEIPTFIERYRYLRIGGKVGEETFGYDRWLNQRFYNSKEWRDLRRELIVRDLGCDLACAGNEFVNRERIIIHHMNPIIVDDIVYRSKYLMDPEYLICTSNDTHNAIHYGDEKLLEIPRFIVRKPNDTCLWRT